MNARKLVLLSLPISVAFIIGGFSGELLGHEGFYWPGAILWGTVIGIIDYNFSILAKLSPLGMFGRIALVLTSAIITSTVGDHIILKDTVNRKKQEYFNSQIDSLNKEPVLILGLTELEADVDRTKAKMESLATQIENITNEILVECASDKGGVGPSCRNLQTLKVGFELDLEKAQERYDNAKAAFNKAYDSGASRKNDEIAEIESQRDEQHDIILEMELLYTEIFSSKATTGMFILFALMVICIETLPLLLKSGITYQQIEDEENAARLLRENIAAKAERARVAKKKEQDRIILRSNRI